MFFRSRMSFLVRFVLILTLLGGTSAVRNVKASPLGTDNIAEPTPVVGCDTIQAPNPIKISGKTMYLDIINPNPYSVAISDLYVVWNWDGGRLGGDGHLWLRSVGLSGTTIWTGNVNAPTLVIPFSTPVLLPGNGTKSTITFTFNYAYTNPGGEELQIDFSTPGCEMYPIHVTN